jgi:glutamate synthase (NADPH/NADH) large chain
LRNGVCNRAKCCLSTSKKGRIISDDELKAELAGSHPYAEWLARTQIKLEELPAPTGEAHVHSDLPLLTQQQAFGYSQEDLKFLITPMLERGEEGTGSMGTDTPPSALSDKSKPLYTLFQAAFRASHQSAH